MTVTYVTENFKHGSKRYIQIYAYDYKYLDE